MKYLRPKQMRGGRDKSREILTRSFALVRFPSSLRFIAASFVRDRNMEEEEEEESSGKKDRIVRGLLDRLER